MLSELVLGSEILNRALDGKLPSRDEAVKILIDSQNNPEELLKTAQILRTRSHGTTVTFSKKVFINLINLCKDVCTYCTYKSEPGERSASMMNKDDITDIISLAKKYRCTEALFVTGERPEDRYPEARSWLKKNGFASTAEYIAHCSEIALSNGLFPHTNAGNLTRDEIAQLAKTNVSIGLMLESSSIRLTERGMPHYGAASKIPKKRIAVLEDAGRLHVPTTTGLLVGIGETHDEIVDSLFAIRDIHDRFGNIQEIILQNFWPKPDTGMRDSQPAKESYFKSVVALARTIMPKTNIQIPPNLSPESYGGFLAAGINDWGGISPLTPDYVNPELPWPSINNVEQHSRNAGFDLRCRFPVYPEFVPLLDVHLAKKIHKMSDDDGFVSEEYWR